MKKMLNIKKLGGLAVFGFLCAPAFAQTPSQNGLPFDESTKQAWVKAHPAEYNQMNTQSAEKAIAPMTEAAKIAWINAHPAEYAKMNGQQVNLTREADYPRMQNTGNPEADLARYNAAKAEFARQHNLAVDPSIDPTRPVLKNTGNPEADMAEYNRAKTAWKAANTPNQ